jgi:hypothetical protein
MRLAYMAAARMLLERVGYLAYMLSGVGRKPLSERMACEPQQTV